MNFLAHAFLSFNQPQILVGNMMSDFVKGKQQFTYSNEIQKGIKLHRAIDTFTDNHAATIAAKQFFLPAYRLYSGAFMDVVYDYFLANDTNQFSTPTDLRIFSSGVYKILKNNFEALPEGFKKMLPYMQTQDWLYNYRTLEGLQKSFGGLVYRSKYITEATTAFNVFQHHQSMLQQHYATFFPEVKKFSAEMLSNLLAV